MINLDHQFALQSLLDIEFGVAYVMMSVALGFTFSGTLQELVNHQNEIRNLAILWGHMHRN